MRKIYLVIVLFMLTLWEIQAQNRQIRFEKSRVWQNILQKAAKENKLVFVDFYASWCGPCKQLVENVFSRDSIADYFNNTFVCARFDIEKDEDGKVLFQKYGMQVVPTLGFFAPGTGELVHLVAGAKDKDWLMEQAKLAQDPQNSLGGMARRFKNGERDDVFLYKYLGMLAAGNLDDWRKSVISDYLNDLTEEEFVNSKTWEIIKSNIRDPLDKAFKRVMNERKKFYDIIDSEVVDAFLATVINATVDDITGNMLGGQMNNSKGPGTEEVVNYLKSLDYPVVPGALIRIHTAEYRQKRDFDGMLKYMREVIEAKWFMNGESRQFVIDNLGTLVLCPDTSVIRKGIAWIDEEFRVADNYLYQANLLHVKASLLEKTGDLDQVKQVKEQENVYLNKAIKQSGGYIMRVFKTCREISGDRIL
ncbi:thioredoxin family protein [Gabonibacter chumensis]|uniref:thioredoxin family protein n=1 Tax=Gabonibacter chumensis TaxID=2972474 RepID=UPI0025747AAF|nr:thioredoxin family protein [Gabonibacter chumensis]MCR9011877.1 thioredoxin family protein [Gabonibacter chumensis]